MTRTQIEQQIADLILKKGRLPRYGWKALGRQRLNQEIKALKKLLKSDRSAM